jgi:flagellar motor switch protein FliM
MSDVLEQAEVDALLKGVTAGSVDTSPHQSGKDGEVRGFDLGLQARVLRSRLPALDSINERSARLLRASMHTLMNRPIEFNAGAVSSVRYADYIASLAFPTSLNLIHFAPLAGTGLIVIEAQLVCALTDLFYGGTGRAVRAAGRDFSATEKQMIESLLELIAPAIVEGWEPVQPARIEHIRSDNTPAFVTIVAPNETMIVNRFVIDIEGKGGEIHFVMPYASLEPLKDVLRASVSTEQHQSEALIANWSTVLRNELEDAEVDLVTVLGSARQTVGGLLDLRPGDVIPCDFDGRATVLVNGTPLFWGELGQQRGKQVVRISLMNSRKTSNLLDGLAGGHS